jgi:hypothetical protein
MPGFEHVPKGWTAQKRRQHDQHFAAVTRLVARTGVHSKGLRDDTLKIINYSGAIADALGVPKAGSAENASGKPSLRQTLERLHSGIAKATSDDLSAAQIRTHHSNVAKLIPVFRQSSQRAAALSRDLLEIHSRLRAIAELYKK